LMILAAVIGVWLWWRGRLFDTRWFLWPAQHVWWSGFVAVISGWIVTETGRQPWVAHGVLRTADAVSPLTGSVVATTLVLFVVVYSIVFAMGIYYINWLIRRGPQDEDAARDDAMPPLAAQAAYPALAERRP
jgi:cytochrome bd ubiquinol oxidase subunit I